MQTNSSSPKIGWQHAAVIGFGLLVFVLLIIADKSNISDEKAENVTEESSAVKSEGIDDPEVQPRAENHTLVLPAGADADSSLQKLVKAYEESPDADGRLHALKDLVAVLQQRGNLAEAAPNAAAVAVLEPSVKNFLVAGAIYRNANLLPAAVADTNLYRDNAQHAIEQLESAEKLEPRNEDVLIELGLAYVESRVPGSAMQGIMKLKQIVDEINPDNEEASFRLGMFSMDTGQWDKAIARFEKVLALNPGNLYAKYNLALGKLRLGNSQEFRKLMEELSSQTVNPDLAALAREELNKN